MKERHSIACASYLLLSLDGKILLLRRFNTGYEDGKYSLPAGGVDKGEAVSDALVREAKEEVGIDIDKQTMVLAHVMHRKAGATNDERIDLFFVCKTWAGEVQNMEPHQCDDLSWFSIDDLPENVVPYVRAGIDSSVKKLLYSDFGW